MKIELRDFEEIVPTRIIKEYGKDSCLLGVIRGMIDRGATLKEIDEEMKRHNK